MVACAPNTATHHRYSVGFVSTLLLFALTLLPCPVAFAHPASPSGTSTTVAAEVRETEPAPTQRILDLHATYQRASDRNTKQVALRDLVRAAATRQQRLASLMERHPREVIQRALSASARASLPAEVQRFVEENVTLEGDLDVLHEDNDTGGRYVHWLRVAGTRLSVHFADGPPVLHSGERVQVRALRVQQALAISNAEAVTTLAMAAPLSSGFGAQSTAVLLVAFQDRPTVTSSSVAAAQDMMFDASTSVSNFFYETSYQQTWLTGNVFGPYVLPYASGACNYWSIATAAEKAAKAAGGNLANYARLVYALPFSSACHWSGLGTIGGSPSQTWVNGGSAALGTLHPGTVSHELGHNFGLYHSHAMDCGTVAIGGPCTTIEYGDTLDVMGSGWPAPFNAAQKERLGWLSGQDATMTQVTSTGTYLIDAYETPSATSKALKIPLPGGDAFYVEFRQQAPYSAVNINTGVVVHFKDNSNPNAIYLLDMTPATSSWWDPALPVGRSFTDTAAEVTIAPLSIEGTTATVRVTIGGGAGSTCVRQNPTVTISPAQQQGGPGVARTYTIAVTNNDAGCAASAFSPQAALPSSGWQATFGSSTFTLGASATFATTMTVQPPAAVSSGSYAISPSAANSSAPSYTSSASALYTVAGSTEPGTFTDAFNRADAAVLGPQWTPITGALSIQGQQLRSSTAPTLHTALVSSLAGATQRASVSFSLAANSGGPRFGVVLRAQDANNAYRCYRQTGSASVLRIAKVVNGVEQVLKTSPVANPAANVPWTLGCRVEGSTLTLEFNGGDRITVSDSSFPAGGQLGLQMGYVATLGRSVSLSADDFTATAR